MVWDSLKSVGKIIATPFVYIGKAWVKWNTNRGIHKVAKVEPPLDPKTEQIAHFSTSITSPNHPKKINPIQATAKPQENAFHITLNNQPSPGESPFTVISDKKIHPEPVKALTPSTQDKTTKVPDYNDFEKEFLDSMDPEIRKRFDQGGAQTSKDVLFNVKSDFAVSNQLQHSPQQLRNNIEDELDKYLQEDLTMHKGAVDHAKTVLIKLFPDYTVTPEKTTKAPDYNDFETEFLNSMDPEIWKRYEGDVLDWVQKGYTVLSKQPEKLRENIEKLLEKYTDKYDSQMDGHAADHARKVLIKLYGPRDVAPIQSTFSDAKKSELKAKILQNFKTYLESEANSPTESVKVKLNTETGLFSSDGKGKEVFIFAGRSLYLHDYNELNKSKAPIVFLETYLNGSMNHPVVENDDAAIVLGACEMLLQQTMMEENLQHVSDLNKVDEKKIENKLNTILDTYSQITKAKPEDFISVKQATKTDKKSEDLSKPQLLTDKNGKTRLLASIGTAVAQKVKWIVASEIVTAEKNNFLPFVKMTNDGKMHFIIPYELKKAGFSEAVQKLPHLKPEYDDFFIEQKDVKNFIKELEFDDSFVQDLTSVYTCITKIPEKIIINTKRGPETFVDANVFEPEGDRT